jgi:hypothetical protein
MGKKKEASHLPRVASAKSPARVPRRKVQVRSRVGISMSMMSKHEHEHDDASIDISVGSNSIYHGCRIADLRQ